MLVFIQTLPRVRRVANAFPEHFLLCKEGARAHGVQLARLAVQGDLLSAKCALLVHTPGQQGPRHVSCAPWVTRLPVTIRR